MASSFCRMFCSTRSFKALGIYLYNRKLQQYYTFTRNVTLFQNSMCNEITSSTDVRPLPSYGQEFTDGSEADLSLYSSELPKNPVEKILSSVRQIELSSEIVYALKVLRVQSCIQKASITQIQNDNRFKLLCDNFENQCHSLRPSMLISCLRSLLEIGLPPSDTLIENLLLVLLSKFSDFTTTDLIGCLHQLNKYPQTSRMKQLTSALVEEMKKRIGEIDTNKEVLMIIELLHLFDQECLKEIQTRVIQLLPFMETKQLVKIICTLAENSKRHVPFLNAIGFYMRQKKEKPNLKETTNVLYALNSLNYHNPHLLFYLTDGRETEIRKSASRHYTAKAGLLNACGQMKWRHSGLLEACGLWILQQIEFCTSRELVSYLLTIAALNYVPKNPSIITTVMNHLKFKDVASNDVWLDVIWSLAVLDHLDKTLLLQALSPQFYKPLLENSDSRSISNQLKLLNLKCLLKIQYPEFLFSCDLFLDVPEVQVGEEAKANKDSVLAALNSFVPNEKYMCSHRNSDTGIFIDAELIMDANGKPLLLSEYGLMSKPTTGTKNLPVGAKRIALMIWLYKDFTRNDTTLTGVNALAVRLLSQLGFVVVEIPFKEFVKNSTAVKKVMYLSQAINNALKNDKPDIIISTNKK